MGEQKQEIDARTVIIDGVAQVFRRIPAGTATLGSPDSERGRYEDEVRREFSTDGFWMADTAVTQRLWNCVMGQNPSRFDQDLDEPDGPDGGMPVECVSWNDCQKFIRKLNDMDLGWKFRLPSEWEWEWACRAGTDTRFWNGDELSKLDANFSGDSTTPVRKFRANPWGLHDMHGNIWEWTANSAGGSE